MQLSAQHGFVCACRRCSEGAERVRAFHCPACDDGPCSPSRPSRDCRELVCDSCEATMEVDDEYWAGLEEAEACPVVCADCLGVLHPYHHKLLNLYRTNADKVPLESRAQIYEQFVEAGRRLWGCEHHPSVARDLGSAARARLQAGDRARAAELAKEAAAAFTASFGHASEAAAEKALRSAGP